MVDEHARSHLEGGLVPYNYNSQSGVRFQVSIVSRNSFGPSSSSESATVTIPRELVPSVPPSVYYFVRAIGRNNELVWRRSCGCKATAMEVCGSVLLPVQSTENGDVKFFKTLEEFPKPPHPDV